MEITSMWLAIIIFAFLVAFVLAFSIGANDVANSFGTSVGSGVLSMRKAFMLATVFEIAGAILLGSKVSDTMRKDVVDNDVYLDKDWLLLLGMTSVLIASAGWLLIATFLKLPISGTHSMVGAYIGFSLVLNGNKGLKWMQLLKIVGSWFVSPITSGGMALLILWLLNTTIFRAKNTMRAAFNIVPVIYAITIFVNMISILVDGPSLLHLDNLPAWVSLLSSVGLGVLVAALVYVFVNPYQRRNLMKDPALAVEMLEYVKANGQSNVEAGMINNAGIKIITSIEVEDEKNLQTDDKFCKVHASTQTIESGIVLSSSSTTLKSDNETRDKDEGDRNRQENKKEEENIERRLSNSEDTKIAQVKMNKQARIIVNNHPGVARLFSYLQIMTAIFGSFAHGGNDVSNAIGPLISIWGILSRALNEGDGKDTPLLILLFGGVGMTVGLWCLGHRVIKTIGNDLAPITPLTGFAIEIASAISVLAASKAGIPVSTTHCKVGAVVVVGWFTNNNDSISWTTFRNIAYGWLLTVPVSGIMSAGTVYVLKTLFCGSDNCT